LASWQAEDVETQILGQRAAASRGQLDPEVGVGLLRGGSRPPTALIVDYVDQHRDELGVEPICRVLQMTPSTYYPAKGRQAEPSARALRDAADDADPDGALGHQRKVYGAHKLWKAARRAGHEIGRTRSLGSP
jgi:putative transposase